MFSDDEVLHYKTFGYVVMRSVFTAAEMERMREEFEIARAREDALAPHDGTHNHRVCKVLGDDTPFFAGLTDDERLLRPAQQTFGDDVLLWEWQVYQYWTTEGTFWHANDGDPTHGRYLYGARYQWPVFEPVTADTGALRVIPGSHLPELQWHVRKADAAGLLADIAAVGAVVCEAELGDVVAFDTRVYHSTAAYDRERRVASAIYLHYPETPQETAVTHSCFGRGGKQWEEWRRNAAGSEYRKRWEQLVEQLEAAAQHARYRLERPESGPSELVAC